MNAPLLSARDIVAGYAAGLPIVQGVGIDVSAREIVTIIGPNGAGKSTLVKALIGLVPFTTGKVTFAGRDVSGLPSHDLIAAGLAFVPQTGNVFASLTIRENLMVGAHTVTGPISERIERTFALFPELRAKAGARAGTLSGGQRQMLAIGRALMTEPGLVILDEPTAGLAPKIVQEVFGHLRRLAESGVAVLMVEQNAKAALRISDRGYVLAEGRNLFDGPATALLTDASLGEAFLGARRAEMREAH